MYFNESGILSGGNENFMDSFVAMTRVVSAGREEINVDSAHYDPIGY